MTVLLIAGGTGGHVIPALAFGAWLRTRGEKVRYVCGTRLLEQEIYREHGVNPVILPVQGSPLGTKKPGDILTRTAGLIRALAQMRDLIHRERPRAVVLFGGYLSLPALIAARCMGVPAVIHEQNAVAGRVTRLAGLLSVPVATGWGFCRGVRGVYTGIPVRSFRSLSRDDALKELGLCRWSRGIRPIVVVLGGSLGSSFLSKSISIASSMVKSVGCCFLCIGSSSETSTDTVVSLPPQWDMSPVYAVADLVICRGGGATLAELRSQGIPAIIAPWEGATQEHQKANATCFIRETGLGRLWSPSTGGAGLANLVDQTLSSVSRYRKGRGTSPSASLWLLICSHVMKGESGIGVI
ncbi:MAG: UDP-diphospho-muramoylpentapeptide beta-N-acetylglucosaminyltransferase [Dethiosulfovibrio peptidovorans]|nr:MAG: UDP-diphospho-muramoylpentapeptide beta-N-acetylglucosaminyltransferase [Dethiosulfovibrio peptidovorans]